MTGTPVVTDSGNNDVTNQFAVSTESGTLKINKRSVTLTSGSLSRVYNGAALTNETVMVGGDGFASGEGATYAVTGSQTLPGSSANAFTYTLNEGTKAENYEIETANGTLTVTDRTSQVDEGDTGSSRKYEITLTANSDTVLYDGEEHSVSGFTEPLEYSFDNVTYTVSGVEASASGTDAGETAVEITGTPVVKVKDGGETDLAAQFTVNKIPGKLTIHKRNVTLTSATDEKEYDGAALTNGTVTVSGDGWASGEGAAYDVTGTQTLEGASENTFTYELNEGTKADNYTVTTVYGMLTVHGRGVLTVVWLDAEGSELDRQTYTEGQSEPSTDRIPDREADAENIYTFSGWKLVSDTDGVKTYEPEFTAEPKALPSVPVTAEGWTGTYDGESHSITVNMPSGASVTYSERRSGPYQAENYAYQDSGTYTVYYRVAADGFEDTIGSANVTIAKAALSPALTLVDPSDPGQTRSIWPYGGPAGVPRLVMERPDTNASVTDYSLPVYSYRDAGVAAFQTYTPEDMETLPVGSYTLRVETAESRNYYAASAEAEFTIIKAAHSNVTLQTVKVLANTKNLPVDLSANLADGSDCTVSEFSGDLISGAPAVSGGILRFDTGPNGNGQIQVLVSGPNYEDYTITVSLKGATSFTLRFDSNGGSVVTTTRSRRPGATYSTLPTTKRAGYTFDGWYTERNGGERVTTSTRMGNIDTTLFAHWTAIDYTVTLRLNGGSLPAGMEGWIETGENLTRTFHVDTPDFVLPEPVLEGYTFTGWTKSEGLPHLVVTVPKGTMESLSYEADWLAGTLKSEMEFTKSEEGSSIQGIYGAEQGGDSSNLTDILREIASDIAKDGQNGETPDVSVTLKGSTQPDMTETSNGDLSGTEQQTKKEQQAIKDTAEDSCKSEEERNGMQFDFMDISMEQTTGGNDSPVEETDRTVEIPVGYDMTGQYNPQTYSYHESDASLFSATDSSVITYERIAARPRSAEEMKAGTYYVSGMGSDTIIYIYTNKFSTYAVVTTDVEIYTVFFETDGGTPVASQAVRAGEYALEPSKDPTKTGLTFDGWYIRESGEEWAFDFATDAISQDTILYARWAEIEIPDETESPDDTESSTPSGGGGGGSRGGGKTTPTVNTSPAPASDSGTANGTDSGTDTSTTSGYTTENPAAPEVTGVDQWLITVTHPAYISGFSDGTFRPNANISRAQAAMMFYRLLKNPNVTKTVSFNDMNGSEWYAEAVYTLASMGVIQGYADGSFHGNDTISRAAFTAIASRLAKDSYTNGGNRFSDVPAGHWASKTIAQASEYGWIGGYSNGTFNPSAPITRAAVTAVINRMLGRSADQQYVAAHSGELNQFSDVQDPGAWYYYNVAEAANGHSFSKTDGKESWNSVNP